MRCKCCDILFQYVPDRKNIDGITFIEYLCKNCLSAVNDKYKYTVDHRYVLEDAEEGVTDPLPNSEF